MPKLLTEDMSADERLEVVETLAESEDSLSKLIGAGTRELLNENFNPQHSDTLDQVSETISEVRSRRLERGERLVNEGFDEAFDVLIHNAPSESFWNHSDPATNDLLVENSVTGVRASHYKHMLDQCIQTIMVDLQCMNAPYTTGGMFQVLPSTRCDRDKIQYCERVPKSAPEMCCEVTDEPATFVNEVMDRRCWERPAPCVRSLSYGLHEDLSCVGARQQVQDDMEAMITYWRDSQSERERIASLFGIATCADCSSNAVDPNWNYDGQTTTGYQNPGATLWSNTFYGKEYNPNPAVSGNCEPADIYRRRLKLIWDHTVNWNTNDPVECGLGNYQLFIPDERSLQPHFEAMFGPYTQEKCVNGACGNDKESRTVAGDPEFAGSYLTSRWARDCLVDYFLNNTIAVVDSLGNAVNITPAANQTTAEYRADNTFLISRNWQATFAMYRIDEFTRELVGTNHWHYFDRGYDYAKRIFWGYVFAMQRPWLTSRVFAFDHTLTL